ncbi:MAG: TonB-dependent receptor domain-containing protein [Phocaeicola sp.]
MNQKIYLLFTLLLLSTGIKAASISGRVIDEQNEPIIGANVYWEGTQQGTTTDIDGQFKLERNKSNNKLVISFIGYTTATITIEKGDKDLEIVLKSDVSLGEVVVSERRASTVSSRTSVLQSQAITFDELCRAACCNLAESFETNPSVDVSYSDAATGARQIKLLGLSGTYVQMLTENYPNFRGAASLYGLDYIPGAWMESIQVSKGTSSVKNGYEALAGQINVEFKKPATADPLSVNLFASDTRRIEANSDAFIKVNKNLTTGLFVHYSRDKYEHDGNGDGFLEMPLTEQVNLMNRWQYSKDNYVAQYGIRYLNEDRIGGQATKMHHFEDPYEIRIKTNRGEVFTKQAFILNPQKVESIALIASATYHDQKARYDRTLYNVYQNNIYASLMYEKELAPRHSISAGVSLNHDGYTENLLINGERTPFLRNETVTGGYAQYTYSLAEKLTILAGIRSDYSSEYGLFITPRMHIKYDPLKWFHIRASVGKGYRTANVLAENNFLLASSRDLKIASNLKQEEAWNTGLNFSFYIPLFGKELTLNAEWYYTHFKQQVVVDVDSNPNAISFYNSPGKSYSHSMQIEATYPLFRGFSITGAFRYNDSQTDYINEAGEVYRRKKPMMSDYKGLATASYQTPLKKWQFDVTGQFNGGGRLPTPDATKPLWEENFKGYSILNAQVTRYFRTWSVYLGGENLTNFKQKNPIVDAANPRSNDFDATMVWGPVHGTKLYVGMRWNLNKK